VRVHLVEPDSNRRGDLFTKRVSDVLHVLGWQNFRFDIAKSGREIDVTANHRTERRQLRAECKAKKDPVGGGDLNKFAGAVDVESRKAEEPVTAYFISLNGFTETAVEQELEADGRISLIDSTRIIDELVQSSVIISPDRARQAIIERLGGKFEVDPVRDLIAHEVGWTWLVFLSGGRDRKCFTLVHANGESLDQRIVEQICSDDGDYEQILKDLSYIGHNGSTTTSASARTTAARAYLAHLQRDAGFITLEGMPADEQIGSRAIPLHDLFVPLNVHPEMPHSSGPSTPGSDFEFDATAVSTETFMKAHRAAAIVGPPGCGKSTLMKRLATGSLNFLAADADTETEAYPLLIRCRSLGDLSRSPMQDILANAIRRAELGELEQPFLEVVREKLGNGSLLLLIDGLDEIADPGARTAFATQLRTFLSTYPRIRTVITSRSSAFRTVASSLRGTCALGRVSDLDHEGISRLCQNWADQVLAGDRTAGAQLAMEVTTSERVAALAVNPLLLTTMLLVKRWIGEIPRKRTILYGKAIEVLAMTWNVEAHEPLDLDEVLPQLGYVALSMLDSGTQRVSRREVQRLLSSARSDMPEILGYVRSGPASLVDSVEHRSSLLTLTGHDIAGGIVEPFYEFKHLAFQEFLAARAVVEGWHSSAGERSYVDVIDQKVGDETWEEVIPLVAVLAGRNSAPLVERIMTVATDQARNHQARTVAARMLTVCLSDDVLISPTVAQKALEALLEGDIAEDRAAAYSILRSKFATMFDETSWRSARELGSVSPGACQVLTHIYCFDNPTRVFDVASELIQYLDISSDLMQSSELRERVVGITCVMNAAYEYYPHFNQRLSARKLPPGELAALRDCLDSIRGNLITGNLEPLERMASYWAIAWGGTIMRWPRALLVSLASAQLRDWKTLAETGDETRRILAWSLGGMPIRKNLVGSLEFSRDDELFLRDQISIDGKWHHQQLRGALTLLAYGDRLTDDLAGVFEQFDDRLYPGASRFLDAIERVSSPGPLREAVVSLKRRPAP